MRTSSILPLKYSVLFVFPIFKFARGFESALDHANDLMAGDITGIGDVVGAEGSALFPKIEAGIYEIAAMGDGIDVVVNFRVTLKFAEVIARIVDFVEGNAQAPDVALADTGDGFFGEAFGAAVEAARWSAESEIGVVSFGVAVNGGRIFLR